MSFIRLLRRLFFAGIAVGLALLSYASCVEPFMLRVAEWQVPTAKWGAQPALKIALLSDTHAIWPWMSPAHISDIVQRVNALHPDLVLLLGDYVGTHPFGIPVDPVAGVAPYKQLAAPCGVFAVIGNHDMHPAGQWPAALAATGIPVLQNQAQKITCAGRKFWVAGLEELWWQHTDIAKTLTQVTDANPVIVAMHNPDSFPNLPPSVALAVAGHTHGGQIHLPFYGAVERVVPSRYGLRYVYGHVAEDGKDLVVTSGLGMTGIPLRFLNPPEISVVTLTDK